MHKTLKTEKISLQLIKFALAIGVAYGLVILFQSVISERPGQAILDQGVQHIAVGAMHPEYNSNPPTSGWHYSTPAEWGMYEIELPDEQVLHNLEHGGIWISYKEIDAGTRSEFEKIARANPKVIITPRQANDAPIALASWNRLQNLEQFDGEIIMNFIRLNKNKSPEPFAD